MARPGFRHLLGTAEFTEIVQTELTTGKNVINRCFPVDVFYETSREIILCGQCAGIGLSELCEHAAPYLGACVYLRFVKADLDKETALQGGIKAILE